MSLRLTTWLKIIKFEYSLTGAAGEEVFFLQVEVAGLQKKIRLGSGRGSFFFLQVEVPGLQKKIKKR